MKTPCLLLFAAIIPLSGCATRQIDPKLRPARFEMTCGGCMGDSFNLSAKGDRLVYKHASPGFRWSLSHSITPSDKEWASFWNEMERIKLWEWKPNYKSEGTVNDGTQWSIAIAKGTHSIESKGDNTYPADASPKITSKVENTKRFQKFTAAVRALIEGREFY